MWVSLDHGVKLPTLTTRNHLFSHALVTCVEWFQAYKVDGSQVTRFLIDPCILMWFSEDQRANIIKTLV
jgi:hypothetical protein